MRQQECVRSRPGSNLCRQDTEPAMTTLAGELSCPWDEFGSKVVDKKSTESQRHLGSMASTQLPSGNNPSKSGLWSGGMRDSITPSFKDNSHAQARFSDFMGTNRASALLLTKDCTKRFDSGLNSMSKTTYLARTISSGEDKPQTNNLAKSSVACTSSVSELNSQSLQKSEADQFMKKLVTSSNSRIKKNSSFRKACLDLKEETIKEKVISPFQSSNTHNKEDTRVGTQQIVNNHHHYSASPSKAKIIEEESNRNIYYAPLLSKGSGALSTMASTYKLDTLLSKNHTSRGQKFSLTSPRLCSDLLGEHKSIPSARHAQSVPLPKIETADLLPRKLEKENWGDLIISADGEIILDFWKKHLKMTIKGDCVSVENSEGKKSMYQRKDLPQKHHKLYMFAYTMVSALSEKNKLAPTHSQARLGPEELLAALRQKEVPADTDKPILSTRRDNEGRNRNDTSRKIVLVTRQPHF